jgi:acyl carrier protein
VEQLDAGFVNLLRQFLPDFPDDQDLAADLDLVANGLDSLETVGLVVELEQRYGIEIADSDLTLGNFSTPRQLWEIVQRSTALG